MKIIDSSAAYRLYQKYNAPTAAAASEQPHSATAAKIAAPQKVDQISLSAKASHNEELGRRAQDIASELSIGVPQTRMQSLKAAVENGEYYVPTAQLADSILDQRG